MPALLIRGLGLAAVLALAACDRTPAASRADDRAAATPAPAIAVPPPATATPGTGAPPIAPPPTPPSAFVAGSPDGEAALTPSADRCDGPVRNADRVMRSTGSPSLVAVMVPVEESIALCHSQHWPDAVLACSATATDARSLFYDCYSRAFGDGGLAIKRRFHALEDNRAASPPAGSADGDYVAIDDHCGTYIRYAAPAYAVYYMCGDEAQAQGPFMLPDDIREFYGALAQDESNRHDIVTDLVRRTRVSSRRVDVYRDGTYEGSHTDF